MAVTRECAPVLAGAVSVLVIYGGQLSQHAPQYLKVQVLPVFGYRGSDSVDCDEQLDFRELRSDMLRRINLVRADGFLCFGSWSQGAYHDWHDTPRVKMPL